MYSILYSIACIPCRHTHYNTTSHTDSIIIIIIMIYFYVSIVGIQKFHMKDSSLECTYTLLKANVVAQIVRYILNYCSMIHYILHYTPLYTLY